jgi:hypothetical protein
VRRFIPINLVLVLDTPQSDILVLISDLATAVGELCAAFVSKMSFQAISELPAVINLPSNVSIPETELI